MNTQEYIELEKKFYETWRRSIEADKLEIAFAKQQIAWGKSELKRAQAALELDEQRLAEVVKSLAECGLTPLALGLAVSTAKAGETTSGHVSV
jgi:hypothetical protein